MIHFWFLLDLLFGLEDLLADQKEVLLGRGQFFLGYLLDVDEFARFVPFTVNLHFLSVDHVVELESVVEVEHEIALKPAGVLVADDGDALVHLEHAAQLNVASEHEVEDDAKLVVELQEVVFVVLDGLFEELTE